MTNVGINPHDDLVQFLRDQTELSDRPVAVTIYEPVVQTKPENITIGEGSRIDSFVKLEGGLQLTIGRYVHVASFAHLNIGGGTLVIGDFAAVASGAKIISGSNQVSALSMSACAPASIQKVKASFTEIGPYACVLCNAVVLPGVQLGEGAVLAAGAVATKNVPPWEIWGGIPARFMSKRVVE